MPEPDNDLPPPDIDEAFEAGPVCAACGGELKKETVPITETENGEKFLIQQVPALVCQECGEIWLSQTAVHELEETLKATINRKKGSTSGKEKRKT